MEISELPNNVEALKKLLKRAYEKIAQLEAENAEFRRRLGMDSSNSHKPPSSDGLKKKPIKPAFPKEEGRRNGGQKGHEGKTLRQVENPDRIEVHLPGKCQNCGRSFSSEEEYQVIGSRQEFDLPQPKLEVTEHRIGQIECCGVKQEGNYPAGIDAPVQYGPGVRALVTMLDVDHKMPLEQICTLFEDIYGYNLNSATVLETLKSGYEQASPLEEASKARLLEEPVVHFDETGLRVRGKLYWLHTATTARDTYLFVHEKRGQKALDSTASVIKDFTGTAVHDCWAPYFKYTKAHHTLCGAHLLRELKGLQENGSQWAGEMHAFLMELYKMPHAIAEAAAEAVRKRYREILEHAESEEPLPIATGKRGRPKQSTGRNLLDRLRLYQNGVLAFALEAGVPFTNNQAERDLRPSKVKQKVSGGFRTESGAHIYARLQGVISTFRKRGKNIFAHLRELFSPRPSPVVVDKGG
ncbi:transposase [Gammaproteobacteria bacterium]